MAKPTLDSLPSHVQDAVKMFDNVVAGHVANNPKLAHEDKLASLVEGTGAFKGHAHAMHAADHSEQQHKAATHVATEHTKGPAAGR